MKRNSTAGRLLVASILLMLLLSTYGGRAEAFTNGQSAALVLGQSNFTSTIAATSQSGLNEPAVVVFDPSGNMWIAEIGNNRILEFRPPFSMEMQASLVIGQQDFISGSPGTSASRLDFPVAIGFDSSGDMWVAEHHNNRVLEFVPPFTTGMSASIVIGQKDFTRNDSGMSRAGFYKPAGIGVDHSGNLWVLDGKNNRVMEFEPPFSNGMNASLVLGQPNFESWAPSLTQHGLSSECGDLALDSSDNVWVADCNNNRVLEFRSPFSNGMAASLVVGEPDFVSGTHSLDRAGLNNPGAVSFDPSGNLWVADQGNHRLLEFTPPFSTGMGASLVIGQPDFKTNTQVASQSGVSSPGRPGFDSSSGLWLPDFGYNRVLKFSSSPSSVTSTPTTETSVPSSVTSTPTTETSVPFYVVGAAVLVLGAGVVAFLLLKSRRKTMAAKQSD